MQRELVALHRQFEMGKPMFGWLFELLLQLLDALAGFHRSRAGHSTPQGSQAGRFAIVLCRLGHCG